MSESFDLALQRARTINAAVWDGMSPGARTAAIYHEMCRMDTGCQRTGTAADHDLPPCPASDDFIARRGCRFAGRKYNAA